MVLPPMNDGDKMPPMPPSATQDKWGKTMYPSADMSEGMDDMMNAGNDWDKTMGSSATQDKWGKTMYPSADMPEGMEDKPNVADTMAMADMKTPDMAGYETPNVADTMAMADNMSGNDGSKMPPMPPMNDGEMPAWKATKKAAKKAGNKAAKKFAKKAEKK